MLLRKKRTDAELFQELRVVNYIFGLTVIIIAVVGIFWKDLGFFYNMVLLTLGILLLDYAGHRYLQKHPKFAMVLMGIMVALCIAGFVVFFIVNSRL